MNASSRRQFLRRSAELAVGFAAVGWVAACSGSAGDRSTANPKTTATTELDATAGSAIGRDAFLAGYPLVTTVRTMQTFGRLFGINQLFVGRGLANPSSRVIVAPNHDTVYALAVLDLRAGPMTLTLPDIPDRYHVFQLIDAWMDNVALVGTRTTGGRAGSWLLVPPDSTVDTPAGSHRIQMPTNQAIILGRVRAVDDADATTAAAIARMVRLEPTPGTGAEPAPVMTAPVGTPQTVGSNGVEYFDELGDALVANAPVTKQQRAAIAMASRLGVGSGRHPTADQTPEHLAELRAAVEEGLRELAHPTRLGGRSVNGWEMNLRLGEADDEAADLERRANIARYYWGPVPASEAVYPRATAGSDGRPLEGRKQYRIHFGKGQTPPVDGFWSITVYGPDMFFVENPAKRYSISGDTPGLVTNADGSLDLDLAHDAPAGRAANWLPVPEGGFNLIMRLYLPRAPIRNGTYEFPPVTVVT